MGYALPAARELFGDELRGAAPWHDDRPSSRELADRKEALIKAATQATADGAAGETFFAANHDSGVPLVGRRAGQRSELRKSLKDEVLTKGVDPSLLANLEASLGSGGADPSLLAKEWTLTSPVATGLVPFDLEAPAKLLTPRPTPLRNSIPRVRGKGAARRFKVISGFTGTGTGGIGTLNGGITESTTNTGPGGLAYVRPPYISYAGYDTVINYVSWGLSDSVSWQAEYQGQGFDDPVSLSMTALLYATMLLDERYMLYARGTTGNGYAGALGTPVVSLSAVAGSVSPQGSSTLSTATYWVVVAADAGDLLGTTGGMHQGPTTAAASVSVTSGQAIQVDVTTDVTGALGYNMFVGSVSSGPFYYAGRTGYNYGYVVSQPTSGATATASASDASAVATNFDGLFTNLAASGGYTTRLNSTFSTSNPGVEFQTAFSSLFDAVKADPDEIWLNGHDRNQLSNALLTGNNTNNYRIYIPEGVTGGGVRIGALVQSLVNQITGKELDLLVHPWAPQGNAMIRSRTLPIPDSNVTETSVMAMVQDYVAIKWPVQQFTYDASTLEIGTFAHYAPTWSGVIQGIKQNG